MCFNLLIICHANFSLCCYFTHKIYFPCSHTKVYKKSYLYKKSCKTYDAKRNTKIMDITQKPGGSIGIVALALHNRYKVC